MIKKFDKIINEISNNIEDFHFNKSVAKIYEYVNLLSSFMSKKSIIEEDRSKIFANLIIIIHPYIPHLSEEIWEGLGREEGGWEIGRGANAGRLPHQQTATEGETSPPPRGEGGEGVRPRSHGRG